MKTNVLLALLFVLCGHKILAQADADILKVKAILERQNDYWNKGDIEGFMKGYWESEELRFVGKSGVTYGYNATLERYKKNYPNKDAMGKLTFDIISADKLSEQIILVVGKWRLKREKDEPEGHFSLLWKNIEGEWVIILDHSS